MKIKKSVAISDSGFVFDASTGDSYTLNAVGTEILELVRGGKNKTEITNLMIEKYDIEPGALERYLYDFLFTLQQMHLIEDYE